jgi:hypothetical protein
MGTARTPRPATRGRSGAKRTRLTPFSEPHMALRCHGKGWENGIKTDLIWMPISGPEPRHNQMLPRYKTMPPSSGWKGHFGAAGATHVGGLPSTATWDSQSLFTTNAHSSAKDSGKSEPSKQKDAHLHTKSTHFFVLRFHCWVSLATW